MSLKPDEISAKVAEVSEYLERDKNGITKVPVDLDQILTKYNLKAYDMSFDDQTIAGAFDREARSIYVNRTDPQSRKIFTLAHELGHYFLHSNNVNQDVMYREKTSERKEQETEADHFAAELLMPEDAIRKLWTVAESPQQMASFFGVSYPAMNNRLRHLGFI